MEMKISLSSNFTFNDQFADYPPCKAHSIDLSQQKSYPALKIGWQMVSAYFLWDSRNPVAKNLQTEYLYKKQTQSNVKQWLDNTPNAIIYDKM